MYWFVPEIFFSFEFYIKDTKESLLFSHLFFYFFWFLRLIQLVDMFNYTLWDFLICIVLHRYTTICPPLSGGLGCFPYFTVTSPWTFVGMFPFAHMEVSLGHLELPWSGVSLEDVYVFSLRRQRHLLSIVGMLIFILVVENVWYWLAWLFASLLSVKCSLLVMLFWWLNVLYFAHCCFLFLSKI